MRELMQMGKGREWDSETYRESLAAARYKQRLLQFRQAQRGHEAYTQVMMSGAMFLSPNPQAGTLLQHLTLNP